LQNQPRFNCSQPERGGTDAETLKRVVSAPALYTIMDSQHLLCLPRNVPTVLIVEDATASKVSGATFWRS
jgi:hypothetical protein